MKNVSITILTFLLIGCSGEKKQYLDESFLPTTKEKAIYYRIIKENGDRNNTNKLVMDYFDKTNSLQFKGYMSDIPKETLEGQCVWFYENGKKYERANYKNGKNIGLFEFWDENGNKLYEGSYNGDDLNGYGEYYYENGNILLSMYDKVNNDTDFQQIYYSKSKEKFYEWYEDGNISKLHYDNGNMMEFSKVDIQNNEFEFNFYYPNGKTAIYAEGVKFSHYLKNYFDKKSNGVVKYYSDDGDIIYHLNIEDGESRLISYLKDDFDRIDALRVKTLTKAYGTLNELKKKVENIDNLMSQNIYE